MSGVLKHIRLLREAIDRGSREDTPERVWSHVEAIEADLESDPRSSEEERRLLLQISSKVSDVLRARRTGESADVESLWVMTSALESASRRRSNEGIG